MFATGVENSIPTIDNGRTRIDQMESCGHYPHWRTDFDCVRRSFFLLRYGLLAPHLLAPGLTTGIRRLTFADLKRPPHFDLDLCHSGVPYWLAIPEPPSRLFAD